VPRRPKLPYHSSLVRNLSTAVLRYKPTDKPGIELPISLTTGHKSYALPACCLHEYSRNSVAASVSQRTQQASTERSFQFLSCRFHGVESAGTTTQDECLSWILALEHKLLHESLV
jgi:hypothetical protein